MKNQKTKQTAITNALDVRNWFRSRLLLLSCCALALGASGFAAAQEVVVETDSLLCEGSWVMISASAVGCTVNSVSWQKTQTDGSIVDVDGTQYFHEIDGNNLKTQSDGSYAAVLSCDDGRTLEGKGQVSQEIDGSKC